MQERSKPNRRSKKNTDHEELPSKKPTKVNEQKSIASAENTRKKHSQSTALNDDATDEKNQLMVPNIKMPGASNQKSKSSKSEAKGAVAWYLQE